MKKSMHCSLITDDVTLESLMSILVKSLEFTKTDDTGAAMQDQPVQIDAGKENHAFLPWKHDC